MNTISLSVVAGALIPFAIDISKRFMIFDHKWLMQLWIILVCALVSMVALWIDDSFPPTNEDWITSIFVVFGTAQVVYNSYWKGTNGSKILQGK